MLWVTWGRILVFGGLRVAGGHETPPTFEKPYIRLEWGSSVGEFWDLPPWTDYWFLVNWGFVDRVYHILTTWGDPTLDTHFIFLRLFSYIVWSRCTILAGPKLFGPKWTLEKIQTTSMNYKTLMLKIWQYIRKHSFHTSRWEPKTLKDNVNL